MTEELGDLLPDGVSPADHSNSGLTFRNNMAGWGLVSPMHGPGFQQMLNLTPRGAAASDEQ